MTRGLRAAARAVAAPALGVLGLAFVACNPSPTPPIGRDGQGGGAAAATATAAAGTTAAQASGGATSATAGGHASARDRGVRVLPASEESDALSLIRTERLKAKAEGRVLVVYASAAWCEPCRKLKEEIHAGRLDDKLAKVTLLAFDADKDTDRLASAGYKFQFIPYVALPGADGHPAESLEARGKGGGAWRELVGKLEEWQGPAR